jgi:pimeloyl-ACP methyl ester carboxylesterase
VQLHEIRHGDPDAPAQVVLVHGLASNARMWDGVGQELAARGIPSVAVDLRGHGGSPKPDDGYDFDSVVADLLPLLDDQPVVAGQSYGGNVVIHLAARHAERVRAIVCVDGGAIDMRARFAAMEEAVAAMMPPYDLFVGTPIAEMERRLRAANPDWPETGIQGALACHGVDADGGVQPILTWERHRQIVEAMWHEPPTPHFPSIDVPVLFIGASERMRPAIDAAVDVLPNGKAIWFEGAHHDVHAQKPVEVADAIAGML